MNIKIEILEIIPKVKYLKNHYSDIISILINSGEKNIKIYDLEKAIKEQKIFYFIISQNNTIKLSLLKNNSNILGKAEFPPINGTKWINLKKIKNSFKNEDLLSISSQKRKDNSLGKNNKDKYNEINNEYYLTTMKNDTIDINSMAKKSNKKSTNNSNSSYINNIKLKISIKITPKSKKTINKNKSKYSPPSLKRGSSQIFLNINKNKNNNISPEKILNITNKDSAIKLKKKLKNVKSTPSIKLSLNQFITNNNLSLNSIYTTINSKYKNIFKLNKNNKSLIDKKQKTLYNFSTKKPYMNKQNDNNYIINENYYNNTINKKIEDLIIDNNFKNKLKSDEIINHNYFNIGNKQAIQIKSINNKGNSLFATTFDNNLNTTNPINKDILKEEPIINKFGINSRFNEKTGTKTKEKKNNSALNVPNIKYDFVLSREKNLINDKKINTCEYKNLGNNDEIIKISEKFKKDIMFYYTKDYLIDLRDDLLFSELKLIIDKILIYQIEYQKHYKLLFNEFRNYKKKIKLIQKNSINIIKKNNKLEAKKINFQYSNENFNSFDFTNKKFSLLGKPLFLNKEIYFFNNLLNNDCSLMNKKNKKTKINNLFLFICGKKINNLNSLSRRYYLDFKKKIEKEKQNHLKEPNLSKLRALITINNITNEIYKEENLRTLTKTSKMNLKTKKYYPNVKTTNRDENKKKQKFIFVNSKSTEKKRVKKKDIQINFNEP